MNMQNTDDLCTPRGVASSKWRTETCPHAPRAAKPLNVEIDGKVHKLRTPCDCWTAPAESNEILDDDMSRDVNKGGDCNELNNSN
jgi:hypothetical protein